MDIHQHVCIYSIYQTHAIYTSWPFRFIICPHTVGSMTSVFVICFYIWMSCKFVRELQETPAYSLERCWPGRFSASHVHCSTEQCVKVPCKNKGWLDSFPFYWLRHITTRGQSWDAPKLSISHLIAFVQKCIVPLHNHFHRLEGSKKNWF